MIDIFLSSANLGLFKKLSKQTDQSRRSPNYCLRGFLSVVFEMDFASTRFRILSTAISARDRQESEIPKPKSKSSPLMEIRNPGGAKPLFCRANERSIPGLMWCVTAWKPYSS